MVVLTVLCKHFRLYNLLINSLPDYPMMCNYRGCSPTRECRCGGPCRNQLICDDKAEEEFNKITKCNKMEEWSKRDECFQAIEDELTENM